MSDIQVGLTRWGLDQGQVRERVYRAATPRERERWHALWLLAQGWPATRVAAVLDRDAHSTGTWLTTFCEHGPAASMGVIALYQTGVITHLPDPPAALRLRQGRRRGGGVRLPAGTRRGARARLLRRHAGAGGDGRAS